MSKPARSTSIITFSNAISEQLAQTELDIDYREENAAFTFYIHYFLIFRTFTYT